MLDDYESIVTHGDSPLLTLAGPGAGKTYLLADRVTRLLADDPARRETTTVLTFATDAREHMRGALLDQEGPFGLDASQLPAIRTMHSFAFEILRSKPRAVGLKKTDLEVQPSEPVRALLFRDAALLVGATEDEGREATLCKARGDCDGESDRCRICEKYWEIMAKLNRVDFDDQVLFANRILETDPDVLAVFQRQCDNLLVDEYQDINAAQFRLIELLSRSHREGLFAVGDDAQSIYGFRGADPRFILRFQEDYPGASSPPLRHSRRCPRAVMEAAEKVLGEYYPDWGGPYDLEYHIPGAEPPCVWQLPSELAEAEIVARLARRFINERRSVLVLAPKASFFPTISRALTKWSVAHECPASLLPPHVLRRLSTASAIARWAESPKDSFLARLAIEEIINHDYVAAVPGAAKDSRCCSETIERRVDAETRVAHLWESVDRETSLYDAVQATDDEVLEPLKVALGALRDSYGEFGGDAAGRYASALARATGGWVDPEKVNRDLCTALDLLQPASVSGTGYAQLLTMRKAKGLEADVVIVVGLEDDIVPSPSRDLAEEARLFYVAMTRAREHLYLFHAYRRPRNVSFGQAITDKQRSCFLDALEIDSEWKTV